MGGVRRLADNRVTTAPQKVKSPAVYQPAQRFAEWVDRRRFSRQREPRSWPTCKHRVCRLGTPGGFSCRHQLYAQILYESGINKYLSVRIAYRIAHRNIH